MMRTCLELAAVTLVAASGVAQTSRGTLSGAVTDAAGALAAGARVALTHHQNGVRRSTVSNAAGIYRFDAVDPGLYELQVEQAGFRRSLIAAIVVEASRTATIDVSSATRSAMPDALVRGAFGASYDRLARIKRKYDPSNHFRLNQNIKPAAIGDGRPTEAADV
jgi:protocatechuate 3,4-dioxygenase beta subunit